MSTQIFAVTGSPILHSKSPNMFNTMFRHCGLNASYLYYAAASAEEAIFLFRQLGTKGMNVTSPFKEKIGEYLDVVHDEAEVLGSVNTIVSIDGVLHGYNTDFYGVIQSFFDAGISLKGRKCLVVGAGGAGKAAAYGLYSVGAEVTIVNRTGEKARKAAEVIGCKWGDFSDLKSLVSQNEIIISALQQNVNPIDARWLSSEHIIFDANYKGSLLVVEAQKQGCTIVSAEDWLLNQAVASYKLFLGSEPDKEIMRSGLQLPTPSQKNHVLATIGIMGAGKSSHGKLLAAKLNYQFKDIDDEIVLREGMSITQIFSEKGETYFRELERDTLQKTFSPDVQNVLSCGGGIVVNEPNRTLLKENALVLWLYATPEAIMKRVNVSKRPLLQCGNPHEKLRQLLTERKDMYVNTAHVVFSTETRTKYESTDILKSEIEKIWGQK